MASIQEIGEEVRQSIKKVYPRLSLKEITPEAKLKEDLGFDSLAAVELSLVLEEKFDIKLTEEDMNDLKSIGTVRDLEGYIQSKIGHDRV